MKKTFEKFTKTIFYEIFDNKPWQKYYEAQNLPKNLSYPKKTLYEIVDDMSLKSPKSMS